MNIWPPLVTRMWYVCSASFGGSLLIVTMTQSMDMEESPSELKGSGIPASTPLLPFVGPSGETQTFGGLPLKPGHVFSRLQPQIHVVPATPALQTLQTPSSDGSQNTPASPMAVSPQQSFNQLLSPQSSRRPKFTMGPRADCEKCQQGVKGHWMHFD